jgi:hypothetical protein
MIEGGARKIRHERAFINGWKVKIKAAAFDSHIRQVSTGGKAQGGCRDRELDTSHLRGQVLQYHKPPTIPGEVGEV